MLIGKNSRHFVRHELLLKGRHKYAPGLPLFTDDGQASLASLVQAAIEAGTAVHEINEHDTVRITRLDVRPDDDMAILLIRRRDEQASTQVFEHQVTKDLWKPTVAAEHAPAMSAHVFIRLTPELGEPPVHRTIIEEVPTLGRSYIQYILTVVLKPAAYEYEDNKGVVKESYTIPRIKGVPSETLGDALQGGGINYVELVRDTPQLDGLDMDGLTAHPQRLKLSVRSDRSPLDVIGRIKDWASSNDWSNVRVQVRTSDDRTKVVEIAREVEAADVLFVRSEVVATVEPLDLCTDTINEELVALAKARLASPEGW